MDFKKCLEITKNFKDELEIEKIFKTLPRKEIIKLLIDIEKYYQEHDGNQLILAAELEKIIFNIPDKYMKTKEVSNFLNLYQKLNISYSYQKISTTIKIEKNDSDSIFDLYNKNFEKSVINYFFKIINTLSTCSTQMPCSTLRNLFPVILMSKGYKVGVIVPRSNNEKIHNFIKYGLPFLKLLKKPLLKTLSNPIPYDKFFINDTDKKVLKDSIETFKKDDYMSSLSLIVPRIESILREVIKKKGGTDLIVKSFNGNKYLAHKTFSECLKSIEIQDFFSEEMILLLKAVFSNNYGLNIRNELAHGLLDKYGYTEIANIIILIIILHIASSDI